MPTATLLMGVQCREGSGSLGHGLPPISRVYRELEGGTVVCHAALIHVREDRAAVSPEPGKIAELEADMYPRA